MNEIFSRIITYPWFSLQKISRSWFQGHTWIIYVKQKVAGRSRSPYEHLFKPNKFNGSTPFHKNHGNRRCPPPKATPPPEISPFLFGIFPSDLSRRPAISWERGGTLDFPWKKKRPFLQDWDGEHEVAWGWLWENIEGLLSSMLGEFFFGGGRGVERWHRKTSCYNI